MLHGQEKNVKIIAIIITLLISASAISSDIKSQIVIGKNPETGQTRKFRFEISDGYFYTYVGRSEFLMIEIADGPFRRIVNGCKGYPRCLSGEHTNGSQDIILNIYMSAEGQILEIEYSPSQYNSTRDEVFKSFEYLRPPSHCKVLISDLL